MTVELCRRMRSPFLIPPIKLWLVSCLSSVGNSSQLAQCQIYFSCWINQKWIKQFSGLELGMVFSFLHYISFIEYAKTCLFTNLSCVWMKTHIQLAALQVLLFSFFFERLFPFFPFPIMPHTTINIDTNITQPKCLLSCMAHYQAAKIQDWKGSHRAKRADPNNRRPSTSWLCQADNGEIYNRGHLHLPEKTRSTWLLFSPSTSYDL